jgi:hypothetical protein
MTASYQRERQKQLHDFEFTGATAQFRSMVRGSTT